MPKFSANSDLRRAIDATAGAVLFAAEAGIAILATLWLGGNLVGVGDGALTVEIALAFIASVALCAIWTRQFRRNLRDLEVPDANSE